MINRGLFSSASQHWSTPKALYAELNKEFHFSEPYPELTAQKLHEAISLVEPPKEMPIRFEVSYGTERFLRDKLEPTLYSPPSPNTILAHYMGMPVVIDERLSDNAIVFVYKTQQGERRELKVLNLGQLSSE